jgi:hypothetical protein
LLPTSNGFFCYSTIVDNIQNSHFSLDLSFSEEQWQIFGTDLWTLLDAIEALGRQQVVPGCSGVQRMSSSGKPNCHIVALPNLVTSRNKSTYEYLSAPFTVSSAPEI